MAALNACPPGPCSTTPNRRAGKGGALLLPLAWVVLLLALRAVNVTHYRVNSDEPQHLHVMWALAEGRMPYRDFFDNHMPLFGAVFAPVVHAWGQNPDVVLFMRWTLFPIPLIGLFFLFLLGRRLFGTVSAWWAVALSLAFSPWSLKSVEVRPDALWATLWFATLWLLIRPPGKRGAPMRAGLLLGCAFATSVKTPFLVAALTLGVVGARWTGGSWSALKPSGSALRACAVGLLGGCLVPGVALGWLCRQGATSAFHHCLFAVNQAAMPNPLRAWVFLLGFPVALWACRKSPPRSDGERATVFLTTAALSLLILGFSPSLRGQTFLPVYPLVILCGVGWLREGVERWLPAVYPGARATACVALAAALTAVLVVRARPWADGLRDQRELLQDTLRFTAKDEFVLDSKGETIFRRRPFYYAYVDVTRNLFASGGLKDAAREGLAETKTRVVLGDLSKFPEPTRSYLKRHYRPLGAGRLRGLAPL